MILVGIGGFFGAICRYLLGLWVVPKGFKRFPLTTWLINVSGSFALGFIVHLPMPESLSLLLATGFLGAYTTFSTFGFETVKLLESKQYFNAVLYVVSSVVLGIAFAALGWFLADSIV